MSGGNGGGSPHQHFGNGNGAKQDDDIRAGLIRLKLSDVLDESPGYKLFNEFGGLLSEGACDAIASADRLSDCSLVLEGDRTPALQLACAARHSQSQV